MLKPIQASCLDAVSGIRHGFFTREGGVSTGPYASLNCGIGSNDARPLVLENRARVARHLGTASEHLLTCHQSHTAIATTVVKPWTPAESPKADAIVTAQRGIAIAVLAADCAPVLFADPAAGIIGAAHAGWKGAFGGILESTVVAMERAGAQRHQIRAALGPCIGPTFYEVGPEFEAAFLDNDRNNAQFFHHSESAKRAHFDLPAYVMHRLGQAGLGTIESVTRCTYADEHLFFSFRRKTHRKEPDYGRQISAIVLR